MKTAGESLASTDTGKNGNSWHPAPRPEWVQGINDLGRDLQGSAVQLLSLDADAPLEQARTRTGLTDFGTVDFMEGLQALSGWLENETELTLMGRIIARGFPRSALSS